MPLYEGIGLIAEKNAVVFDIGSAHTKVGYAGETTPRAVVATPQRVAANIIEQQRIHDDQLYEILVPFVHELYFKHLLVNPKDRRVVLVDDLLGPIQFKSVLSRVLFRHFEVLSILYAPSHLMPMLTLGTQTGLVMDAGFSEVTLVPVYEGVPILKAWQGLPLGSLAVQNRIRELLADRATIRAGDGGEEKKLEDVADLELPDETVEDVLVRLCFVTNLERGGQIQQIREDASSVSGLSTFLRRTVPSASYPVDSERTMTVDGVIRESACEVMFEQDADRLSVSTMVLDAILSCPIDTRRNLAENIVIVGGTSMAVGFKARLIEEVKHLLTTSPYKDKLCIEKVKVHQLPCKGNYVCWVGASLFGATDAISTRSFTRDAFTKEGAGKHVPDWSNLRFNPLACDQQG